MKNTKECIKPLALKKLVAFLFVLAIIASNAGLAQLVTITGQVTSKADGKPLPKATVTEIDSKTSTATDEKGFYRIQAPVRGTLIFSRSGMKTLEEPVKNRKEISVALEPATIEPVVDQVVVVIPGNVLWKSTGLLLKPSDIVEFKATGNVCFYGEDPDACVGPNGYPREYYWQNFSGNHASCEDPMGDEFEGPEGHAGLIAKTGSNLFFVGTGVTISGLTGALEIGINDCLFEGIWGNSGQFSVVIKVTRGAN